MASDWNRDDEPVVAKCPEWLPIIEQAAASRSTRDLPKPPPNLPHRTGAYYCTTRTRRTDGTVRVYVKWYVPGWQTYVLGSYIIGADPRVPVGRVMTCSDGLQRRIIEHPAGSGLPWPVLVIAR